MKIQSFRQHPLDTPILGLQSCHPVSCVLIVLMSLSLGLTSLGLNAASVKLVSADSQGNPGNGSSNNPAISANGRYVVYHSDAGNLVAGDTNNSTDIFHYDRKTGITSRISVASQGQGSDSSVDPRINSNGRYVVYSSAATNLVEGDTNVRYDIFLFDTKTGATGRVSVDSLGVQGNGGSFTPSISANGRYIVYESEANNLVKGDNNLSRDIFLYDRKTGATRIVSVDGQGNPGNAGSYSARISANGRYVVYHSDAGNLVPGDTNSAPDVFLFDRKTGATTRISVHKSGAQGNGGSFSGHISANGRWVTYSSDAGNLVDGDTNAKSDIFLYDRTTGITRLISLDSLGNQGNDGSYSPRISSKGRYVVYASDASNLVNGDANGFPDVFRFDKKTGITSRISVGSQGNEGTGGGAFSPSISTNGRYVVYESFADNLVAGDVNNTADIFLYDIK